MTNDEKRKTAPWQALGWVTAVQAVGVAVLLVTLLILRLAFPKPFSKIAAWYHTEGVSETTLADGLGENADAR